MAPDQPAGDRAFSVLTEPHGDALVVRASGEVDVASARSLEREIRSALDINAEAVLLDLRDVSFIDSTGLGVLLAVATASSANGNRLRITRLSAPVQRAIDVSGLADAFPLVN